MAAGSCPNRAESPAMNVTSRSLVLMNYFPDNPDVATACKHNSAPLAAMMNTCYEAAGRRWPNFIAVDFYKVLVHSIQCNFYMMSMNGNHNNVISCREVMVVERLKQ